MSRPPGWRLTHFLRLQQYEMTGSLYGGRDADETEEDSLRDLLERGAGIPMGYGRVGRLPAQLFDCEARAQFRARRRH